MLITEPRTFHESVIPLVYFNCIVGMGPQRHPNISNTVYFCLQIYTIIFISIYWTMTYIGLTAITDRASEQYDTSPMAHVMLTILDYTNACIAVTSPFLIWLKKKGLQDCLQQMSVLDDTFEDILGARNEYRKQYIRLICQVTAISLFMSSVCYFDYATWIIIGKRSILNNFAILVALHYPITIMLVLDLNFCTCVGYVLKKFRDLNDVLLGLNEKPSTRGRKIFVVSRKVSKVTTRCQMTDIKADSLISDNRYLLHEIRKAHLELCKLSRKVNLVFGMQNLLSMGISFVMVTGLLYTIYSDAIWEGFSTNRLTEVLISAVWTIIYIFKIWIVNHSCSNVSSEAERTGEVIYELLGTKLDEQLQKEIHEFGVQMLQNPVRFNACGFFPLEYTFVQGVIGSITTYLVILIQMSHISDSLNCKTVLAANSTEISQN